MLNVRIARIEDVISASMQYDKVIMTQKNYWTPGQTRVYFYTVLRHWKVFEMAALYRAWQLQKDFIFGHEN